MHRNACFNSPQTQEPPLLLSRSLNRHLSPAAPQLKPPAVVNIFGDRLHRISIFNCPDVGGGNFFPATARQVLLAVACEQQVKSRPRHHGQCLIRTNRTMQRLWPRLLKFRSGRCQSRVVCSPVPLNWSAGKCGRPC